MKSMEPEARVDTTQRVFALQHLDTGEYICLLQEGTDYLACFTDGDSALEFRSLLGLQEHVDLCSTTLERSPFAHFWLDGESRCYRARPASIKLNAERTTKM